MILSRRSAALVFWLGSNYLASAQDMAADPCARLGRGNGRTVLQELFNDGSKDFLWGKADDLNECLNSLTISNYHALFTLHNVKYGLAAAYAFTDIANDLDKSIEKNTCGFSLHSLDVDIKGFVDGRIDEFSDKLGSMTEAEQQKFLNETIKAAPFHLALQREFNRLNDAHTRYDTPYESFYYVLPIRFDSEMRDGSQIITLGFVDHSIYYKEIYGVPASTHKEGDVIVEVDGKPVLQWMKDMVASDGPFAGLYQGALQRLNNRFFVKPYVDRVATRDPPPTAPLKVTFADGSTETINWLGRLSDYTKAAGWTDVVNTRFYNTLTNWNPQFQKTLDFETEFYEKKPDSLWDPNHRKHPTMTDEDLEVLDRIFSQSQLDSGLDDDFLTADMSSSEVAEGWIEGTGFQYSLVGDAVVVVVPDFMPVEKLSTEAEMEAALYESFYQVQEFARENGVRRLLFDVSSNGGGLVISSIALQWYVVNSGEDICTPIVRHMTENWQSWVSSFGVNYDETIDKFFQGNPELVGSPAFIQGKFQKLYLLMDHAQGLITNGFDREHEVTRLRSIEASILSMNTPQERAELFKKFLKERSFLDKSTQIGSQLAPQHGWFLFDNEELVDPHTKEEFSPPLRQFTDLEVRQWGKPSNYSAQGVFGFCNKVLNNMPKVVKGRYDRNYWTEVAFVTDGNCGSACSMFTQTLQLSGAATAFTFGSLANQAMDVASFGGGNV
ncbi:hypothetical protein FOZ63_012598, partial [Perkinsus olseni]